MSEEICEKCGLPKPQCICGTHVPKTKEEREADRVIEIKHKFEKGKGFEGYDEELEGMTEKELKEKLKSEKKKTKEYEGILELQARKEFDDQKEALLSKIDEEHREEVSEMIGDDPDKLERLKDISKWTDILTKSVEQSGGRVTGTTRKPSGKARIPPQTKGERGAKEWIDNLYAIAKDPSRTQKEKDEANRMLDEMFLEVIKGMNVAKRRTGRRLPDYQTWVCPQCKKQILQPRGSSTESCPSCGWTLYTKEAVVKA